MSCFAAGGTASATYCGGVALVMIDLTTVEPWEDFLALQTLHFDACACREYVGDACAGSDE